MQEHDSEHLPNPRWRHQMETFSALLALCARNSPVSVNSVHKGQGRGALIFSLICARKNDWINSREAGDLRRHCGHYDAIVMSSQCCAEHDSITAVLSEKLQNDWIRFEFDIIIGILISKFDMNVSVWFYTSEFVGALLLYELEISRGFGKSIITRSFKSNMVQVIVSLSVFYWEKKWWLP